MANPLSPEEIDQIQIPQDQPAAPNRSMAGKIMSPEQIDQIGQMTPEQVDRVEPSPEPPPPAPPQFTPRQVDTTVPTTRTVTSGVRSLRPMPQMPPPVSRPVPPGMTTEPPKEVEGQYEAPETAGELISDVFWLRPEIKVMPQLTGKQVQEAARSFVASSLSTPGFQVQPEQLGPLPEKAPEGAELAAGYANSINNTLNFFTGAKGILTTAIPGLPAWAKRLVQAGFAWWLGKHVSDPNGPVAQLGDELGKNKEDRDYRKIGQLSTDVVQQSAFAGLAGGEALKPGVAADFGLRDVLTRQIVEEYNPQELRDVFQKVNRGEGTEHENDVVRFINSEIDSPGQALRKGVRITSTEPMIRSAFWQHYLGLEPGPGGRTVELLGQQPTEGGQNAPTQQGPMAETGSDQAGGVPKALLGPAGEFPEAAGTRTGEPQPPGPPTAPEGGTGPRPPLQLPPVPPPEAPVTPTVASIDWSKLPKSPKEGAHIVITDASGKSEPGLFHGYWEMAPGQPLPGNKLVISRLSADNKWTTGSLHPGDRISDGEVPTYQEWSDKQPAALSTQDRVTLSVIKGMLTEAKEMGLNVAGYENAVKTYDDKNATRKDMAQWPPIADTLKALNQTIAKAKEEESKPPPGFDHMIGREVSVPKQLTTTSKPIPTDVKLVSVSGGKSRTGKQMVFFNFSDGHSAGVQLQGGAGLPDRTPEEAWDTAISNMGAIDKRKLMGPPADAPREEVIKALEDRLIQMAQDMKGKGGGAHMTGTWFEGGINYPSPGYAYIKARGFTVFAKMADLLAGKREFGMRETITPGEDKPIGRNAAGEQLYERPDGSVYRMHYGKPDFGGDLSPVEQGPYIPDDALRALIQSDDTMQQKAINVKKIADQRGITQKQAQEAVEREVVWMGHEIASNQQLNPYEKLLRLIDLYKRQPNLSARTSGSVERQAYSTPVPLAFILGHMTGVDPSLAVFDDTAGNGMLFIGSSFPQSEANELDPERAANLKELGLGVVTSYDATKYEPPQKFSIVHLNPPFGKIDNVPFQGFGMKKLEYLITAKGLEAMLPNGTAGIILGAGMEENAGRENKGALWVFENWLYSHYDVVANFEVEGDLYAKQGAKWPVQVIVVAGRKAVPIPMAEAGSLGPKSVARLKSWEEIWAEAEKTRSATQAYRAAMGSGKPTGVSNLLPSGGRPPANAPGTAGAPGGAPATTEGGGNAGGAGGGKPPTGKQPSGGVSGLPPVEGVSGPEGAGLPPKQSGPPGQPPAGVEGGAGAGGQGAGNAPTGGGKPAGGGKPGKFSGKSPVAGEDITGLSDSDLDDILDTASEELKGEGPAGPPQPPKSRPPTGPKQPRAPRPPRPESQEGKDNTGNPPAGKKDAGPPAPPGTKGPSVADTLKELKDLGINISNETVQGLDDLFGGGSNLGSFGPSFDERRYAQAKEHFKKAWEDFKKAAKTLVDFAKYWIKKYGEAIKPYIKRFMQDVQREQAETKAPDNTPKKAPPEVKATELQVPTPVHSKASQLGTLVPKNIADAIDKALTDLEKRNGPVDEYVADRLNMDVEELRQVLAGEQIDGVALGIDQFERGGALIIGDETGIGKGRQAAAMLRYALLNDMIPIFFTKDPKLFSDMWGDLSDIHTKLKPLIFGDPGKASIVLTDGTRVLRAPTKEQQDGIFEQIQKDGWEASGYNAIFSTYSQINVPNARQAFLEGLTQNKRCLIVMDEAHEAAGDAKSSMQAAFFSGGSVKRKDKASGQTYTIAKAGILNANGTKQGMGGVGYLSATYAKRAENMPVFFRTDLSKATQRFSDIVEAMKNGGVALQQAVSEALAKAGQYVRRERDFSGVRYDMQVVTVADPTKLVEQVDGVTDILSQIVDFSERIRTAVAASGSGDRSTAMSESQQDMTDFAAIVHNQIGQLLLAAKADEVVNKCVEAIKNGEKPVVALMNTMESFLDQWVEDNQVKPGQKIKLRWNELTKYALKRTLRVTEKLPGGGTNIYYVNPDEYGLGELYRSIQATADALESQFPVSPIDYIIQKLKEKGIKMLELTGRESGIDYTDFAAGEGTYKKFQKANKNTVVNTFNAEKGTAMLLNASGSTGLSAHASEKFKDQSPRHMIIAQAALDINVFMQTLGRIRRTGMVLLGKYLTANFPKQYYGKHEEHYKGMEPGWEKKYQGFDISSTPYGARYTHLVMPLQAELRPAAMTARKMKSLNANTTAEADNAIKLEVEDIMNKYGDQIVAEYLDQNPEIQGRVGLRVGLKEDGTLEFDDDLARRFTGRMALLPDHEQKQAYDWILPAYRQRLEQLKATGEYDLEIVVHNDWDGIMKEDTELSQGTDESNIFTSGNRLQRWEVRDMRHVPTGKEMLDEFTRKTGGRDKLLEKWEEVKANGDQKLVDLENRINEEQAQYDADEARKESLSESEKTAHDIQGSRITHMRMSLESQRRRWERSKDLMDHLVPEAGKVIEISNNETGDVYQGMLVDIRWPTNRYAPGAFRMRFLLHTPGGVAYITGAQIAPAMWQVDRSEKSIGDLGPGDKNARYERFFVVGNPIAAYNMTGGRGKVVRFKSHDGQTITGLQMPRNWGPGQLVSDPRLELVNGRAATHYLVNHSDKGARPVPIESGQIVRVMKPGWGSRTFTISTSKAKGTGGKIFLDQQLRAITGDFNTSGNRMTVSVDERDLPRAIDRMMQITGQRFRPVGEASTIIPDVQDSNRRAGQSQASIAEPGAMVEQTGIIRTAEGVRAIRQMFEDPQLPISDEARRVALAMLDEPVMQNLDWSKLQVSVMDLPQGQTGRAYVANMLIDLARGGHDPSTFPHEVFHFLWELLPQEVKDEVEHYRQEELNQALAMVKDATQLPDSVQVLLGQMLARGGITSEDYLKSMADITGQHPDLEGVLTRWYHLSSPQEYLSGTAGNQYGRSEFHHAEDQTAFERLMARLREWLGGLLDALKRVIGRKPGIKRVIDDLLAGKYRNTPEGGAAMERWQSSVTTPPVDLPDDDGMDPADLEMENEKVTTKRMGTIDTILGRERMTAEMRANSARFAQDTFRDAGLQVVEAEDGYYELADPDFEAEPEGRKLLKATQEAIATQQQAGETNRTGALAYLLNSIRLHMVDDDVSAFSPSLRAELYAVTQGEASHRGLMLGALAMLPKTIQYVARNVRTILQRTYSDAFGGDFVRKILGRIVSNFRDYFTDEEIRAALDGKPELKDLIDKAEALSVQDEGGTAYRWVQRLLKPKFAKTLARMQRSARTEEAVRKILEDAEKLGHVPKPSPPGLDPINKLILAMNPKQAVKIAQVIRGAIEDAERNAGRKIAIMDAKTDQEREELLAGFAAGEEPTPEQVERGLELPEFVHWRDIRDNFVGYDPITLKLSQDVIKTDFKGTRFGKPIARPADTRIDLEKLAQEPEAEVERVLDAYWTNLEANMDLSKADDLTRARVLSIIETQLAEQLQKARERVRAPLFAEPPARGVAPTPEQALGRKINAGLFSDPRLDLAEYVQRVANRTVVQRVMPKAADMVKQVMDTPFYRQSELAQNFGQMLINKFGIPVEVADRAAALFETAFQDRMEKARAQAVKRVTESLTPQERKVSKPGKPLWHKVVAAANAGIFDSTEVLRGIAAAKGWAPPTDAQVQRLKDLAEQLQRLQELTPEEKAEAGNDPEALRRAQVDRDAVTAEQRAAIAKKISALWARMVRPISWMHPISTRKNINDAIAEFQVGNMLLKLGFGVRLPIHILTQLLVHIPTRAVGTAWMRQVQGSPEPAWKDLSTALADGYGQALAALRPAIRSAASALAGRGQSRNVDRLTSGVLMFERMEEQAKELAEQGKHAQAVALRILGLAKFSLRFVQAVDNFQGVPAEFSEMMHQLETSLQERGMDRAEIEANKERIFGKLAEKRDAALAKATAVLQSTGRPFTEGELYDAAWSLVRSNIYEEMRALGLDTDDFRARNELLRRTIAWQERVMHGPGGVLAAVGRSIGAFASGLPAPFGALASFTRFANAIGTGLNYSLMFTPAYALAAVKLPGAVGESPWFASDEDRYQRRVQAIFGSLLGAFIIYLILSGKMRVFLRGPKDKEERELWEAQGHRPGTVELVVNDHEFIPMSLTVGPASVIAPYAATAGAVVDLIQARQKAQEKLNKEAEKLGIAPGKVPAIGPMDIASVSAQSVWGTLISGKAFSGLVQSGTEYGVPNLTKMEAAVTSPSVLGLPAYQELTRAFGVQLDSKLAGYWDFLVPTPGSQARALNMLGDPVGTPSAVQQFMQTMTAGTYPWLVDSSKAKDQTAYAALLNSGYRPPSIDTAKGYPIDGEFRPMNKTELAEYSAQRGQLLKQAVESLGAGADASMIKAAYTSVNEQALQRTGVDVGLMAKVAGGEAPGAGQVPGSAGTRYVSPTDTQAPRISGGAGGGAKGLAHTPNLRRGARISRSIRGARGPSLRPRGAMRFGPARMGSGIGGGVRSLRPR